MKLYVFAGSDESVDLERAICFVHQLKKDIAATAPKLSWEHDVTFPKIEVYVSPGLNPDSKIVLEPIANPQQPSIQMSYSRAEKLVFRAFELCGEPETESILLPLYYAVRTAVNKSSARR